jgi:hypothetical protein
VLVELRVEVFDGVWELLITALVLTKGEALLLPWEPVATTLDVWTADEEKDGTGL